MEDSGAVGQLSQARLVHPRDEFVQERDRVLVQTWDSLAAASGVCLEGVGKASTAQNCLPRHMASEFHHQRGMPPGFNGRLFGGRL